jgi:hypothetical protein
MKDAPKGHLILVKLSAGMERKEIAVTAQYHPDHGGFATPKLGVWAPTVIDGMGWMEIPGLARVDAVHGLEGPHG